MNAVTYFVLNLGGIAVLALLELRSKAFREETLANRRVLARAMWYVLVSTVVALGLREFNEATLSLIPVVLDLPAPAWLGAFGCIMVGELLNYWFHRLGHRGLWCFHYAHHVETHYSVLLGTQAHPAEILLRGLTISVTLTSLGFTILSQQIYLTFFVIGAWYQHSANDYSLGLLDWFLVNPRYHRFHHTKGLHINFGATIVIWDVVFGTMRWPRDQADAEAGPLGLEDVDRPYGYWLECVDPIKRLLAGLRRS